MLLIFLNYVDESPHLDVIMGGDDDNDPGQTYLFMGRGDGSFQFMATAYDSKPDVESGNDEWSNFSNNAYDFDDDGDNDVVLLLNEWVDGAPALAGDLIFIKNCFGDDGCPYIFDGPEPVANMTDIVAFVGPGFVVPSNKPPEAKCKDDIVTAKLEADGTVTISPSDVDTGSFDSDGDPITLSVSPTEFDCSDIGAGHALTLTATDDGGLSGDCAATVTVVDKSAPVPDTDPLPQVTGECSATVTATPTATDNCAGTVTGTTNDLLNYSDQGTHTVTWAFNDEKGNTANQSQDVAVSDVTAPDVQTKNITVQLDENGTASIIADQVNNGSSDACGIASMTVSLSSFTCANVGENEVVLTVTDNNGNSREATAIVTVVDNTPPNVQTQNITVQLDENGNASIIAANVDNGSGDNCGIASMSVSPSSFTCGEIGANTVTLTVTDRSGNISTDAATVTVADNVAPTAAAKDITVQLDANGNASITAGDVDDGSGDNCGIASMSVSPSSFTCGEIGANMVTLTVTDSSGNSSTETAIVTVEDNVPPVAVTKDITVQLNSSGNALISSADINNGSHDACGITSLAVDTTAFTCSDVGDNTVTLTVTDNHGNNSTATATVTVEDNVPPVAVTKDIMYSLTRTGMSQSQRPISTTIQTTTAASPQ